jgi:cob(I)alamin adenosyltransferase
LYTRGGDSGETGLYGSKRVGKDSRRVEAYGSVDELNSFIGLTITISNRQEISKQLKWVQGKLLVTGADLASELSDGNQQNRIPRIERSDTDTLERMIDQMQKELPRLANFILPGGGSLSAHIHLARSVCRRAERAIVALGKSEKINPELVPFFNRLSTYLFNLARYANMLDGTKDELWQNS